MCFGPCQIFINLNFFSLGLEISSAHDSTYLFNKLVLKESRLSFKNRRGKCNPHKLPRLARKSVSEVSQSLNRANLSQLKKFLIGAAVLSLSCTSPCDMLVHCKHVCN